MNPSPTCNLLAFQAQAGHRSRGLPDSLSFLPDLVWQAFLAHCLHSLKGRCVVPVTLEVPYSRSLACRTCISGLHVIPSRTTHIVLLLYLFGGHIISLLWMHYHTILLSLAFPQLFLHLPSILRKLVYHRRRSISLFSDSFACIAYHLN